MVAHLWLAGCVPRQERTSQVTMARRPRARLIALTTCCALTMLWMLLLVRTEAEVSASCENAWSMSAAAEHGPCCSTHTLQHAPMRPTRCLCCMPLAHFCRHFVVSVSLLLRETKRNCICAVLQSFLTELWRLCPLHAPTTCVVQLFNSCLAACNAHTVSRRMQWLA